MTQTEALRLALEALADLGTKHYENTGEVLYKNTYTAIKAALEAKDEPPRFPTMLRKMWSGTEVQEWVNENWQAPPQRKPLTDEEIWDAYMKAPVYIDCHVSDLHKFARAIEAAHGIKGEA